MRTTRIRKKKWYMPQGSNTKTADKGIKIAAKNENWKQEWADVAQYHRNSKEKR